MNIYCINKSTVLSDKQVQEAIPAFNKFIQHVRYYWPQPCNLIWCEKSLEPKLAWKLIFADTSDEAGALGYHDFTPDGRPVSYVFAADDEKYGYSWTVTATHEIAEMIADPFIADTKQITNTEFYATEICDPVEADDLGYEIKVGDFPSVLCSDFVTKRYFIPGSEGYVLDYTRKVETPCDILPGGYMYVFVSGQGWKAIYADKKTGEVGPVDVNDIKWKMGYGRMIKYARDRRHTLAWKWDG